MRWVFAILFILIGSFLFVLTIDDLGKIGQITMDIIGLGCFFLAGFIIKGNKGK